MERSPRVEELSWGRVVLDDGSQFKDAKLFPGGARAWDWGETGTGHRPGIQLADVAELLDRGAEVVVLTRGVLGRLGVRADTLQALESRGIEVVVARTPEAVETYNQLRESRPVGALIHSTC